VKRPVKSLTSISCENCPGDCLCTEWLRKRESGCEDRERVPYAPEWLRDRSYAPAPVLSLDGNHLCTLHALKCEHETAHERGEL
jgi:hypothetical protein